MYITHIKHKTQNDDPEKYNTGIWK